MRGEVIAVSGEKNIERRHTFENLGPKTKTRYSLSFHKVLVHTVPLGRMILKGGHSLKTDFANGGCSGRKLRERLNFYLMV